MGVCIGIPDLWKLPDPFCKFCGLRLCMCLPDYTHCCSDAFLIQALLTDRVLGDFSAGKYSVRVQVSKFKPQSI